MASFENPSNELVTALLTTQNVLIAADYESPSKEKFERVILDSLNRYLSAESLENTETDWYVHHSIIVRLNAAEYFYNSKEVLAGDLQTVLAFASYCKLVKVLVTCNALERQGQQIYRRIYADKYS